MSGAHIPVMLDEVLESLAPSDGGVYVDGTFGGGSYTRAILEKARCKVIAFDRDGHAIKAGSAMEKLYAGRLDLRHARFGDVANVLGPAHEASLDGIVLDLGVSSMQLDTPERGFSFQKDGPLDMRMGGADETDTPSAADLVNTAAPELLKRILSRYGEEKRAGAIVRAIAERRIEEPFKTTADLSALVERVLGKGRPGTIHPATRTFQALRIFVNRELSELVKVLFAAERLLRAGGRLVVVSFHSLEDRIVKTFLASRAGKGGQGSRHRPVDPKHLQEASFHLLFRGVKAASEAEIEANIRSRSAKLRAAERTAAPAWAPDWDRYALVEEVRP